MDDIFFFISIHNQSFYIMLIASVHYQQKMGANKGNKLDCFICIIGNIHIPFIHKSTNSLQSLKIIFSEKVFESSLNWKIIGQTSLLSSIFQVRTSFISRWKLLITGTSTYRSFFNRCRYFKKTAIFSYYVCNRNEISDVKVKYRTHIYCEL